jgi:hypothetical protein
MKTLLQTSIVALLALGVFACESRTDEAEGGVILTTSDFDELPFKVSVTGASTDGNFVSIGQVTIDSVVVRPGGPTSDLMTVEMDSYRVTYSRIDQGTRVPPTLVRTVFGNVPAGGNTQYDNLVILGDPQLSNPPLSELLASNGGFDKETGLQIIVMNLELTFFGQTIGGDRVSTQPARFTIEFVP